MNRKLVKVAMCFVVFSLACPPFNDSAVGATAPQKKTIALEMAIHQEGAPVEITSAMSTLEFFYQEVGVRNTSPYTVTSVTFGVVIYPLGAAAPSPVLVVRGRPISANLRPEEERVLMVNLLRPSQAYEKAQSVEVAPQQGKGTGQVWIDLGVIEVQTSDGPLWTFDPEAHGGFREMHEPSSKGARTQVGSCPQPVSLSEGPTAAPKGYFYCHYTYYCLYCENHLSYCISRQCPVPPGTECTHSNCPFQNCQYSP